MENKETIAGKKYLRAKKSVEKVKEVYVHVAVFNSSSSIGFNK